MENIAEQIFASIKTIFEQLSFWVSSSSLLIHSGMARGMKFISIPYHKSLTETKQFTYTLHPIPKIVCNQFSKANTQCDTIMEAAAGIDTTRVNAINFLFSESDNRKKEVNNKRHIHHARQRHIDTFPPIPTPEHSQNERRRKKGFGLGKHQMIAWRWCINMHRRSLSSCLPAFCRENFN